MKHTLIVVVGVSFLLPIRDGRTQSAEAVQAVVSKIQSEIEEIRGLEFKHPVTVKNQSAADFGNYLDRMLDLQIPKKLAANYGKVVKKLGLYRGPEIEDLKAMAKKVMQSQAAAYYDPASEAFYVVMQ